MYAIIKTGGKQFRVTEGLRFRVEKLDAEVDSVVELDEVLALNNGKDLVVGTPLVEGAKVVCRVLRQARDKKIVIFTYKAKNNDARKQGHRQPFTELVVEKIVG